jgi:hypothetical protein
VGWKSFMHQVEEASRRYRRGHIGAIRRSERPAMRGHHNLVSDYQERLLLQRTAGSQAQAAEYASYIAMLKSLHHDCGEPWNWHAVLATPPPPEPVRQNLAETQARAALQAHDPGFFDKMLGGAKQQRSQLEEAVQRGTAIDQHHYDMAVIEYRRMFERWRYQAQLAPGVIALHPDACRAALWCVGAFDELEWFTHQITLDAIEENVAIYRCAITDPDVVPKEEIKLGASGKVLQKDLTATKYWDLYQDHVASCALRIARESYAVLPIDRVIVNVQASQLDPRTGHMVGQTILAVHFTRNALLQLNFVALDPSESLKNFPHRMKFKKTAGFEPVASISADEQWISV